MSLNPNNIEVIDEATAEAFRRRTGVECMMQSLSMFAFGRDLIHQAVRDQHPDWSDEQVREEAFRRIHRDRV